MAAQVYDEDEDRDEEELRDTLMRVSRLSPGAARAQPAAELAKAPASAAAALSDGGYPSKLLSELLSILRRSEVITRGDNAVLAAAVELEDPSLKGLLESYLDRKVFAGVDTATQWPFPCLARAACAPA
jgi:hypothetical protein